MMKLLDSIQSPEDLKKLSVSQLPALADEIRRRIVEVVGKNGGHLASNLGVADITLALHYAFDFTTDRLLWDVGHQCYPHKLVTGRNKNFDSLRKAGGCSGFPSVHESPYDLFDVGHAGTSIATAVGLALADQAMGRDNSVVALIGDASIVNGLAFEGLNQAGMLNRQFLVVLNDNKWGISPTQGAFAEYLAKMRTSPIFEEIKGKAKQLLPKVPVVGKQVYDMLDHLKEGIKSAVSPNQIFEQLGFIYIGPCDGHDVEHLIELFTSVRKIPQPVLLHLHTEKGKGCNWATADPGRFHSPKPFTVQGDKVEIHSGGGKSWTSAFADVLIDLARSNDKIFAMTAGMLDGTGLNKFAEVFPDRCRDIGIAESCTVDMAGGMAKAGLRPVCAIYSTFLQRAFDQVFQEVVLQGLPVIFCMDRAGLVGGDGAVHHGFADIAYLRGFPKMVLMAPADEMELRKALELALTLDHPCAIRYPRDNVPETDRKTPDFVLGRARLMRKGTNATILAYGTTTDPALDAAEMLAAEKIDVCVYNARFAKPIDQNMVADALVSGRPVVTVEDHSIAGGFGSAVLETACELGLSAGQVVRLGMPPDRFVAHGSRVGQLAEVGIDAAGIASAVHSALEPQPERFETIPTSVRNARSALSRQRS